MWARQSILLSCVVNHNGRQPIPHLGRQKNKHVRIFCLPQRVPDSDQQEHSTDGKKDGKRKERNDVIAAVAVVPGSWSLAPPSQ